MSKHRGMGLPHITREDLRRRDEGNPLHPWHGWTGKYDPWHGWVDNYNYDEYDELPCADGVETFIVLLDQEQVPDPFNALDILLTWKSFTGHYCLVEDEELYGGYIARAIFHLLPAEVLEALRRRRNDHNRRKGLPTHRRRYTRAKTAYLHFNHRDETWWRLLEKVMREALE